MTTLQAAELTPLAVHQQAQGRLLQIGPWHARFRLLLVLTDAVAISAAVTLSIYFRFGDNLEGNVGGSPISYSMVGLGIGLLWVFILDAIESRTRKVIGAGPEEYRRVLNASLYTFGLVAIGSYLTQTQLSRLFFATTLPLGALLLLAGRWSARAFLNGLRSEGRAMSTAILVGETEGVRHALRQMRHHPEAGYRPTAVCLVDRPDPDSPMSDEFHGLDWVERHRVADYVKEARVGAVAVAGGLSPRNAKRLSWSLENTSAELMFVPQLVDVAGPRISVRPVEGLGLLQVELPRYSGWNHMLKRAFDGAFATAALVLLSPVLVAIAVAIKLDDGGPVLFRQQRVGVKGEPFTIHKFRTMSVDAEAKIAQMIADAGGQALLFKVEDDPRITRIGRFLRKYSLDELPQFWTVLRGTMSIVGPRPQVEREVAEYTDDAHRRLLIKPGITGLWQVSGRSELSIEESIRLDLRYVENWSLTGDLAIILRTIRVVLVPSGAY